DADADAGTRLGGIRPDRQERQRYCYCNTDPGRGYRTPPCPQRPHNPLSFSDADNYDRSAEKIRQASV
ncbi:MAG TPA: hypothetical protein VGD08_26465, partial [Stellaceae bacterium]